MPKEDELMEVEEEWQWMRDHVVQIAEEVCGAQCGNRRRKKTPWWSEEVKLAVKKKQEAWKAKELDRSEQNIREYRRQKSNVMKVVKTEKIRTMMEMADKLEEDFGGNKKMIYGMIKEKRVDKEKQRFMKYKDGVTNDPETVKDMWKSYFKNLLNVSQQTSVEDNNSERADEKEECPITKEEVNQAIKGMKNGKSPGADEFSVEMIKAGGPTGVNWMYRVVKAAWDQKRVPNDWLRGVIVPIFKKGDRKECNNYRGITLQSQGAKIYERVIERRVRNIVEPKLREEQYGFRRGRSTIDLIFALRQIMERRWEEGKALYMVFLDLEKAYDHLPREKVWTCLQQKGVSNTLVERIKSMYQRCESCVQTSHGLSEWFKVSIGLRQGSVLSPILFDVVMDEMLRRVDPRMEEEEGQGTKTLIYADDIVELGDSAEEVQQKVNKWNEVTEEFGMKVSIVKSELLVLQRGKKSLRHKNRIKLRGVELQEKEEFQYLGSMVTNEAKMENEVKRRVGLAEKFYQKVRKLVWNEQFPKKCKMLLYKQYYLPILTYGAVTWPMGWKEESAVQAAEMKFIRSVAGVTKLDKIRSSVIRKKVGVESLKFKMGKDRLRWYGHMRRMEDNRIPRQAFEIVNGKRRVGRPRDRWQDQVQADVEERGEEWSVVDRERWWEDRNKWRELVSRQEKDIQEENED